MAKTHSTSNDSGDFTLHASSDGTWEIGRVQAALLADIRRELRKLNETLSCYRVRQMADAAIRTDRRLARPFPLNRKKAK